MNKYLCLWLLIFLHSISFQLNAEKLHIGLCIVATGKYISFVKPLIESAEKYFCPYHKRTYFIFTDCISTKNNNDENFSPVDDLLQLSCRDNIVIINQHKYGWPYDTLMRFSVYDKHKDVFDSIDYLYATDADMLFVGFEGDEILGDRVATNHPGFIGNKPLWGNEPPYDRNIQSTAYIKYDEGTYYFAGGFYGGTKAEFLKMVNRLTYNIQKDLPYIAIWHDESHLNRYFIDNLPTVVLDRSYCFPENGIAKGYPACSPKLLALDKNHDEIRQD